MGTIKHQKKMDNKKVNTVIVDDDALSRKLLNVLLKKFPEINVVGEAANIPKAIEIIKRKKPDSIFLDVCLDNETGFELMQKIKTLPKIVFVSAYDSYALKAFDVNALDYLQKPIVPERLAETIKRLVNSFEKTNNINGNGNGNELAVKDLPADEAVYEDDEINENDEAAETQSNHHEQNNKVLEYDDRLFITFDGVSKFLKVNSIVCITAEKDYSYIYTNTGKKHLVLKSMVEWEERLTPKYFVRIHRSTIVNLEYVEKVEKWFNSSYHVYLQNKPEPFKMSRRYAAKLKERFK